MQRLILVRKYGIKLQTILRQKDSQVSKRFDKKNIEFKMSCKQIVGPVGTLEVLSKAKGWLTVSPNTMSKKNSIDKHVGYYDKMPL